jgi:hypothetical protein
MASDAMDLAYGVIGDLGADVADIRVRSESYRELHLPGIDLLLMAGMAVSSAFFRGLISGILKETEQTGQDVGRGLVRRFTRLLGRLVPSGRNDESPGTAQPSETDVLEDFRRAAADAERALTDLGVAAGELHRYAAGAQADVVSTLRELGIRDERVERIGPAVTSRLITQVENDRVATS